MKGNFERTCETAFWTSESPEDELRNMLRTSSRPCCCGCQVILLGWMGVVRWVRGGYRGKLYSKGDKRSKL